MQAPAKKQKALTWEDGFSDATATVAAVMDDRIIAGRGAGLDSPLIALKGRLLAELGKAREAHDEA